MAGEEKLLSDAVTVCSTSSWLVQTTVVPGATVMVAGTMLKFSMLTDGPPDVSTGWAGLGGGRVASAAGGTGVESPEAGDTVAAAVGAQPAIGTMPTSKSAPTVARQPGLLWTRIAYVDMDAQRTSRTGVVAADSRAVDGCWPQVTYTIRRQPDCIVGWILVAEARCDWSGTAAVNSHADCRSRHHPVAVGGCISSRVPRPALASGHILQVRGVVRSCAIALSCLPHQRCFWLRRPVRPPLRRPLARHYPPSRSPLPGPMISASTRPRSPSKPVSRLK